jgi:hypothetical protein
LRTLSPVERERLGLYLTNNTTTMNFAYGAGVPIGLVRKGILYLPSEVPISGERQFAFNIAPWARELLKESSRSRERVGRGDTMEFRLLYEGPLATNGTPREKHAIRQAFHPQLAELFKQSPLSIHSAKFLNPCIWRMPFEQRARSQWIKSRRQPPACVSRTTLVSPCSVELRCGITLQNLFLSLTSAFGMRHSQLRW